MRFGIYDRITGVVLRAGEVDDVMLPMQIQDPAKEVLYTGEIGAHDSVDLVTKTRIIGGNRPPDPRPGPGYKLQGREWVVDVPAMRLVKKLAVHAERDRRMYEPIVVDGTLIDADEASQAGIQQKLDEITDPGTVPYPELLRWRGTNNLIRDFANIGAFRLWLQQAVRLLAKRRTEAQAWSWQRKADLAATPDQDVAAFVP